MSGTTGSGLGLERGGRQFDWRPKGKCLLGPSETMGHRDELTERFLKKLYFKI